MQKSKRNFVLFIIFCFGTLIGVRKYVQSRDITTISLTDAISDYEYMWKVLDENYPFLGMAERKYGLSMDALKENYLEQIEALGKERVDFCDYYEIMQGCIGKFKGLAHLSIYTPYSYQYSVAQESNIIKNDLEQWYSDLYQDPKVKERYNFLSRRYKVDLKERNEETESNLMFKEIRDDIAYIKINSFESEYILKDQYKLSEWFNENAQKKHIIIDITGNSGGNDLYWKNLIIAPNIDKKLSYNSFYITPYGEETREQFRLCGIGSEDLNPNLDDLLKLPRVNIDDLSEARFYGLRHTFVLPANEKKVCNGQFYLLVDNMVYSAADGFAAFCKATKFATIIGENTRGDGNGINVFELKLPNSGLILRFRAMNPINPDGSSSVEYGTTPDVIYSGKQKSGNVSFLGICLDYINSISD